MPPERWLFPFPARGVGLAAEGGAAPGLWPELLYPLPLLSGTADPEFRECWAARQEGAAAGGCAAGDVPSLEMWAAVDPGAVQQGGEGEAGDRGRRQIRRRGEKYPGCCDRRRLHRARRASSGGQSSGTWAGGASGCPAARSLKMGHLRRFMRYVRRRPPAKILIFP